MPVQYIDIPNKPNYYVIAIRFEVASYWAAPYTYDDKPYMRIESTTVVMPREIFEDRLMRSKSNNYKWEDQICDGISINDLEEQRIRGSVRLGIERGRMPESSLLESTDKLVERLKLTVNGRLKNAAAALFLHDTSNFPQFLLRMARFRGNNKDEFIDNQRAYGNFFTLLDAGMAFFFKHLSISGKVIGFSRDEKLEIPAVALREALTNALCHRQFHNTSSSVGIAIYDDRVEIENSGHLPEELTVENIKESHQSFPRNPVIADVLFKTTFLESWGSGVGRMVNACREVNLPEPEYAQNSSFVWVTFKRPKTDPTTPTTPITPSTPTTSEKEIPQGKQLKTFLSSIGDNGANLKTLMEKMRRKDRKGFIITYIAPNVEANYIAMLYPEVPNHPMQSYYLTEKGRELLRQLFSEKVVPITPTTPSTSGKEKLQGKRLETFLSSIGNDGANIKTLMERMKRKDKKSFVNTYINPNLESGYITMLYPDIPNHPMQSYHLTEKGLEILRQFTIRISKYTTMPFDCI